MCPAQGKALAERRASGALEAAQRQALAALQRTAADVKTHAFAARQWGAELAAQQTDLERQAEGANAECDVLRAQEASLQAGITAITVDKYQVLGPFLCPVEC